MVDRVALRESASDVPALATLPIVRIGDAGDRVRFLHWHEYLRSIYGDDNATYDLNSFTWFYWTAPTNVSSVLLTDCTDDVPLGVPWIGGRHAWTWGPEHMTRRLGYFVQRGVVPSGVPVEVLRVGPTNAFVSHVERKATFHFHTVGSGIFWNRPYRAQKSCQAWHELVTAQAEPDDFWVLDDAYTRRENRTCTLLARKTRLLMCAEIDATLFPLRSDYWRHGRRQPARHVLLPMRLCQHAMGLCGDRLRSQPHRAESGVGATATTTTGTGGILTRLRVLILSSLLGRSV